MIIQIRDLVCRFGDVTALDGISLSIAKGQVFAVIGPSGSGKSTLLRCLNALEDFQSGEISIDGIKVDRESRQIHQIRLEVGMVFQQFNLFPHLSVMDNIKLAQMVVRKKDNRTAENKGRELLEKVGLADRAEAYPGQLSGGQKQRVAIARALAMEPRIMLFDEVTSSLDPEMVGEVLEVMARLAKDGMTMLVATHEIGFAREIADEVIFIEKGRIIEQGPPEVVLVNPHKERTREFLKSVL